MTTHKPPDGEIVSCLLQNNHGVTTMADKSLQMNELKMVLDFATKANEKPPDLLSQLISVETPWEFFRFLIMVILILYFLWIAYRTISMSFNFLSNVDCKKLAAILNKAFNNPK